MIFKKKEDFSFHVKRRVMSQKNRYIFDNIKQDLEKNGSHSRMACDAKINTP